jgi:PAS domain S-box-containing protein
MAASIALGLFVWIIDAGLDYFFFYSGTFLDLLILHVPSHELYIRSVALGSFVLFGLFASNLVAKRERAEERSARLNAVLDAIRSVNQLIVQEKDRARLLQGACHKLVQTRGFDSAWIALLDPSGTLTEVAQAGLGEGFEDFLAQSAQGRRPRCIERALSQEQALAIMDPASECVDCPLAVSYPGRVRMAVRLEHDRKVAGLLAVSLPPDLVVDEQECSLLVGLAGDLAYALRGLEQEERRIQMEALLSESEVRFRRAVLEAPFPTMLHAEDGEVLLVNRVWTEITGYSHDQIPTIADWTELAYGQRRRQVRADIDRLYGLDQRMDEGEYVIATRSGESRTWHFSSSPLGRLPDGRRLVLSVAMDVTERMRAEMRLREAERRFRSLLDNVKLVAVGLNREGRVDYANPYLSELTGYTVEEMRGKDWFQTFIPKRDRPAIGTLFSEIMAAGIYSYHENPILTKDGEERLIAWNNSMLLDTDGTPVGTMSIGKDITEQVQMEARIRESAERYRSIVELAPQGIVTVDLKGVVTSCNTAFERLSGFERDEIVGQHVSQMPTLRLRDIPKHLGLFKALLEGKAATSPIRFQWERKDGSQHWGEAFVSVMRKDGRISGLQAIVSDVTERRRADEERAKLVTQIRAQARQMRMVLDTVPEGVLVLDAQNRAIMTNRVADQEIPLLAGAAVGDTLTHLGDRKLEELLTSPPKGLWHEVASGSRSFEVIARPIENGAEAQGWVLVLRDVTTEREVQRRMQQQERLAAVGQLAAGIAHDFNNIMSVIVLYAQLVRRSPGLPADVERRMETIADQAGHATELIQQILDFGRRSVLERRPMDLAPFLKELIKLLERTLPESIEIGLTYGTDAYKVNADPTRMQQAIMNLAVNARDAMPQGGQLRISLQRLRVVQEKSAPLPGMAAGEWVRLTVSDSGTGIPPDVLPHIFEPFFTTKAPGKGSGLGLAQVYGIVKQHEGELDVRSKEGQGTTFLLYLPALEKAEFEAAFAVVGEPVRGQGQCVLVVEDNAETRHALVDSLELLGYRALTAASGRQALETLERRGDEIDLVLSDVVMPEMGGVPMLHAMRERGWSVPVVMLTGHSLQDQLEGLRAQGMIDWLPKPPSLEQLARVIARALGSG